MFTVCSKCNLRLTVTATDLRAAQGYVRCGRCHNVFNALAALADDPGRAAEAQGTASATQSRPALTPPEPPAPEAAAPPQPADLTTTDTSLEFNPASTNINEVFIEASLNERTGTFESIVLVGEDPAEAAAPGEAEPVIAPQALSAPSVPTPLDHDIAVDVERMRDALAEPVRAAALEAQIPFMTTWSATTARSTAGESSVETATTPAIAAAVRAAEPLATAPEPQPAEAAPDLPLLDPAPARRRLPDGVLRGIAVALTLCLLVQLSHHYRGQLADTSGLHGPMTALYQALGRPLESRWDISRYEIRTLGTSSDGAAPDALVVRASISNRASRDQPLPLLRVVMQDRFSNRVAARDLTPAEYLGRGAPQVSLMAPGQRVDVQVAFRDPGQAATGFEIDACMMTRNRLITCTNDPGGH